MDPNETLRKLRELAVKVQQAADHDIRHSSPQQVIDAADELATLALELDRWIVRGGFLPRDWTGHMPPGLKG